MTKVSRSADDNAFEISSISSNTSCVASTGRTHCHGFAWADDVTDPSAVFKANNLFFVSYFDHLAQRGYVTEVPGAPMCGCAERMPVVTRSDCTQIDVNEWWTGFGYVAEEGQAGFQVIIAEEANLEFNACEGLGPNDNNNLLTHYTRLVRDGKATKEELALLHSQSLVDREGCPDAITDFMASQNWIKIDEEPTDENTMNADSP